MKEKDLVVDGLLFAEFSVFLFSLAAEPEVEEDTLDAAVVVSGAAERDDFPPLFVLDSALFAVDKNGDFDGVVFVGG